MELDDRRGRAHDFPFAPFRASDPAAHAVAIGVDLVSQRHELLDPGLDVGAVAREQLVEPASIARVEPPIA
jgi:hypothetical protein